MSLQILNIVSIPLIAGIVGYITNKLAIKMLFRPYYPKWYTLGWQGIIPSSRGKLASLIGNTVANKLLSHEDISSSIFKKEFTESISSFIAEKLASTTTAHVEKVYNHLHLEQMIHDNAETIDKFASKLIYEMVEKYLSTPFPHEKVISVFENNLQNGNIVQIIADKLLIFLNEKLNSDDKLSNILPKSILAQKDTLVNSLTEKAVVIIKDMGRSIAVKDATAKKLVEFKNTFFSGNGTMDMLKMGFINMVLNDETISNAVKRELPSVMDSIADDINVRNKISSQISLEINKLLSTTIKEVNQKLTQNQNNMISKDILSSLDSDNFKEFIHQSLSSIINSYMIKYQNISVENVLKIFGFDLQTTINNLSLSRTLLNNIESVKNAFFTKACEYIKVNRINIAENITVQIEPMLREGIPAALKNTDIAKTVEDKINDMPLAEVENVLFSFMKDHFKWINRLGFILGFLIGSGQVAIIYFLY